MQPEPQHRPLEGKVLVIIGGTTGIGLSAGRAFVAAGARLVVVGLDGKGVEEVRAELGGSVRSLCGDARKPETAAAAVAEAVRAFGSFHGLYHVAGGSGRRWGDGPLHEISDEGWQAVLDLNLTSVMHSNRAAVRQFMTQGGGGTILNMGSVLAVSPSVRHFATHAYASAKAAIVGLTKACAAYYAPHNIRLNVIAPGLVATPMSRRAQQDPTIAAFVRSKQPLDGGRLGLPADLDAAAVYFMSDASKFTTGQVLTVDGAWSLTEGQAVPEL